MIMTSLLNRCEFVFQVRFLIDQEAMGAYQVPIDARQQHHISQGEVQPLSKQVLQRRQLCGLHFPDLRVLSSGQSWNCPHRQHGQSCPDLQRRSVRAGALFALPLLFELLPPDLVVVVDFDGLPEPALQGEDGRRRLLLQTCRPFQVLFNSRGNVDFTESGPFAYLTGRLKTKTWNASYLLSNLNVYFKSVWL